MLFTQAKLHARYIVFLLLQKYKGIFIFVFNQT